MTIKKIDRASKRDALEFIDSTVGYRAWIKSSKSYKLVRVEYYREDNGNVRMILVSGNNLYEIPFVPHVVISAEEFEDRDCYLCDSLVEWRWAIAYFCGVSDYAPDEY